MSTTRTQKLVDGFIALRKLKQELATELREEMKCLEKQHPDWPLSLVRAQAEANLDAALKESAKN